MSICWGRCEKSCSVRNSYMHRSVVDSITVSIRSCRTASDAGAVASHCVTCSVPTATKPIEMISRGSLRLCALSTLLLTPLP